MKARPDSESTAIPGADPIKGTVRVFTVGHSNHTAEHFIELLRLHKIQVVADVRTQPWSRYSPHFNRAQLRGALRSADIDYAFLGDTLGGRPQGDEFYDADGHVLYGRTAEAQFFREGLERLCAGARTFNVAMMCSEGRPEECHRHLLVARVLAKHGVHIHHILPDGSLIDDDEIIDAPAQPTLWGEGGDEWRSVQSVLHSTEPANSSESSELRVSID